VGEVPDVKHFEPDAVLDQVVRLFWERGAATTGIAEVVDTTGLSRSSLYATFGGKRELYVAALRRYVERQSQPVFQRLADDGRGLPAISEFFDRLVRARCEGEHARWGCMVANAHAGPDRDDPDVRQVLEAHHTGLREAMRTALRIAHGLGQVPASLDPDAAADVLALLAYGVNLRSRAGAAATELLASTSTALHALTGRPA
jgi:AcrR family transcriptional regulator